MLVGGSDDEAASTNRCRQERLHQWRLDDGVFISGYVWDLSGTESSHRTLGSLHEMPSPSSDERLFLKHRSDGVHATCTTCLEETIAPTGRRAVSTARRSPAWGDRTVAGVSPGGQRGGVCSATTRWCRDRRLLGSVPIVGAEDVGVGLQEAGRRADWTSRRRGPV
jgi:hypothetical protein